MPLKKKEEKETVVYPASKRKAAPFKPLRPSKAARTDSTGSERSSLSQSRPPAARSSRTIRISDEDEADKDGDDDLLSDSDTLEHLPPSNSAPRAKPGGFTTARATHAAKSQSAPARPPAQPKPPRGATPFTDSEEGEGDLPAAPPTRPAAPPITTAAAPPPIPSQSDEIPTIPQALLVRLLHEHFADKSTQIDKQALRVLQKYMEVFVRESIARAKQAKEDAVDAGRAEPEDRGWLELEDLEKVAPGMMVDF